MSHGPEIEQHRQSLRALNAISREALSGPNATVSNPAYFKNVPGLGFRPTAERKVLHRQWIDFVIQSSGGGVEGGKAVVMAGPPGAGKGTVQREFLNLDGYVVCDPDIFKGIILEHELASGQLDLLKSPAVRQLEAGGERFAPMDFATQVHRESSMLRDLLQDELMSKSMNLVIDTVLANDRHAEHIMSTLESRGYTFAVVSVQASQDLTKAGIQDRWEKDYRKYLEGEDSKEGRLGGRPVPSEFANSVYREDGVSVTEGIARNLAEQGEGATSFQQYRRLEGTSHSLEKDLVKRDGKLISKKMDRKHTAYPSHRRPVRGLGVERRRGDSGVER